jgi:hypothetical protein
MDIFLGAIIGGSKTYYHSTNSPLVGNFKIKGKDFYGIYLSPSLKYSKNYGYITYKVTINPKKTLVINDTKPTDENVKKLNFFNITKPMYDDLISRGYDSISWSRKGKLLEFIILDISIIKNVKYN